MEYISYGFYCSKYKGSKLSSDTFESLSVRAGSILDSLTFDRIRNTSDDISMAVCAIAEALSNRESAGAAQGIASEQIGDVNISYRSDYLPESTQAMAEYKRIAMRYVKDKSLFYRGR